MIALLYPVIRCVSLCIKCHVKEYAIRFGSICRDDSVVMTAYFLMLMYNWLPFIQNYYATMERCKMTYRRVVVHDYLIPHSCHLQPWQRQAADNTWFIPQAGQPLPKSHITQQLRETGREVAGLSYFLGLGAGNKRVGCPPTLTVSTVSSGLYGTLAVSARIDSI